ncbi:hypothetical protein HK104_001170 [Borealophlyctis nickersoniae]|nr:hypothetical protein HK104_001170 [Borealophlyctis nickersoniae]
MALPRVATAPAALSIAAASDTTLHELERIEGAHGRVLRRLDSATRAANAMADVYVGLKVELEEVIGTLRNENELYRRTVDSHEVQIFVLQAKVEQKDATVEAKQAALDEKQRAYEEVQQKMIQLERALGEARVGELTSRLEATTLRAQLDAVGAGVSQAGAAGGGEAGTRRGKWWNKLFR